MTPQPNLKEETETKTYENAGDHAYNYSNCKLRMDSFDSRRSALGSANRCCPASSWQFFARHTSYLEKQRKAGKTRQRVYYVEKWLGY